MDGKRLIEKIKLRNILSFGDKGEEIELQPLNIIIGQNASGKSNLVDVIKLLRSLPDDNGLGNFIRENGGISEWTWKGNATVSFSEIELIIAGLVEDRYLEKKPSLRYRIRITETNWKTDVIEEVLEEEKKRFENSEDVLQFFSSHNGKFVVRPSIAVFHNEGGNLPLGNSVFSQIRDFANYYEISYLGTTFSETKIYSDLNTHRSSSMRVPQIIDKLDEFLDEDGSNLSHVLNNLNVLNQEKGNILNNLKKFYPRIKDYEITNTGDYLQFYLKEEGLEKPISAKRLSDGTLRYLCLLAILCHPEPPPLICIEEPETGLHPDILPTIAELMIDASKRTQLIVTTHSDILVSAFSAHPEAVLVCEKDEDGTHFKRLEAEKLKVWLDEYKLGEVWLRGGIGGTRW
jgi:predicted ATPase